MTNLQEILIAKYQEEHTQARQHEQQRASVTNYIIIITGALLSFVGFNEITFIHPIIGNFLILLGGFGAVLSQKHYERFRYHIRWAKEYDKKLFELENASRIDNFDALKEEHLEKFVFSSKVRLNVLWTGIQLVISVIGCVIFIFTLIKL